MGQQELLLATRERELIEDRKQVFFADDALSATSAEQHLPKLLCAVADHGAYLYEHAILIVYGVDAIITDRIA